MTVNAFPTNLQILLIYVKIVLILALPVPNIHSTHVQPVIHTTLTEKTNYSAPVKKIITTITSQFVKVNNIKIIVKK